MINIFIRNIIFVSFPLLIYFFYVVYKNMKDEKEDNLFLILSLFSSLYLCLKFGDIIKDDRLLIFCNIPIVIAYVKKKGFLGVILSVLLITYSYIVFDLDIIILMIIKYIIYFLIYIFYKKNNFINVVAFIQGFILSFEYFVKASSVNDVNEIFGIVIIMIIFYIITFAILYLFEIADRISKLYLSYKELEHDKQIKNSLFKLTHEVKNPIAVCKGYLDMLDLNDKNKSIKYINIMKTEINRTLNIMNDFLELNKIKIQKEILDVNMLIYDITDSITYIFSNKNIKLINNISEDEEVYIMGNYDRLKQVFINLLKNSYESINEKGTIYVNGKISNKNYIIEIVDDGIGMDEDVLKNIKSAFFTTKQGGNGIGVSLSNEIIIAHRGSLNYKSKTNMGTKTIIKLPIININKED